MKINFGNLINYSKLQYSVSAVKSKETSLCKILRWIIYHMKQIKQQQQQNRSLNFWKKNIYYYLITSIINIMRILCTKHEK